MAKMMMIIRCPYCKERIKKGAVRCKHCHSGIGQGGSSANDDGVKYLQNGFNKINAECDAIEDRIKARTGLVFVKHQYSSDELYEAASRIESFVEKMSGDLEMWESENKLNQQIKLHFNRKAGEVYQRLESLHYAIEEREPTWWEKVCDVFKRILSKILPFLSFKMISGKKAPKEIAA
jgi:hypothetical protein